MEKFNKNSTVIALIVFFLLVFVGMKIVALAATTPSLGLAASYGVLASTYTNTTVTTINGDVGFTTGPATAPLGVHTNYGSGAPYATAGTDQGTALSTLASQPCTFTFAPGAINLSTDTTHGTAGVYTPGVYCSTGAMDVAGPLTLSGSGTYIFRLVGALTSTAGAVITLSGASACDVFWTPSAATTLAANTTFFGTVIDNSGITVGANTTWTGRALAFGGTVTTDTTTITVPTCTVPPPPPPPPPPPAPAPAPSPTPPPPPSSAGASEGTINVVKKVINDSGGNKVVGNFSLFVNGSLVTSGMTNTFTTSGALFTVTENADANYTRTFSGDCDSNGQLNLNARDNKFCIVTNDDIGAPAVVPPVPPLIDVVKVANPLALPAGPGSVVYTYTLRNIGTVPVTNVTMVGDTCSPIILVSGDTNGDAKLDLAETWTYRCSTTLSATHTNNVVATGWANGISAVDIASATVVVGAPIVPPIIHVTKVPSSLALSIGGGMVTYTKRVTNPGTVALSNVHVTDDTCSPVTYISGDANSDAKLDPAETWVYTCQKNLTQTTTNTAIAAGEANGFVVRDFAIATVVVAVVAPALPNTGFAPEGKGSVWNLAILVGILMIALVSLTVALRKRSL